MGGWQHNHNSGGGYSGPAESNAMGKIKGALQALFLFGVCAALALAQQPDKSDANDEEASVKTKMVTNGADQILSADTVAQKNKNTYPMPQ